MSDLWQTYKYRGGWNWSVWCLWIMPVILGHPAPRNSGMIQAGSSPPQGRKLRLKYSPQANHVRKLVMGSVEWFFPLLSFFSKSYRHAAAKPVYYIIKSYTACNQIFPDCTSIETVLQKNVRLHSFHRSITLFFLSKPSLKTLLCQGK